MKTVQEAARQTPVSAEVEVLVVGGGTAGAVAGIAAARAGKKTLIVEQFGFLGGSPSAALVTPVMVNAVDGKELNTGIHMELLDRLSGAGDAGSGPWFANHWFNPEAVKYVLEEMALEAGARMLYHSVFSSPVMEGKTLGGVIVENKSGRQAIVAERTIDCTADADVAHRAGVPCKCGRDEDGVNQAMSLRFQMGNVDLARLGEFLTELNPAKPKSPPLLEDAMVWGWGKWGLKALFERAVSDGVLEYSDGNYFQMFSMPGRPGEMAFNCPRISDRVKGHEVADLTNAQIEGRQKIRRLVRFLRGYVGGFEQAYISLTAPMVGVRESRRIVGEYVLQASDWQDACKFADGIARNRYPIDIHSPSGAGVDLKPIPEGEYHEIPYRSLVPLEVENLLVAGRCISASFVAQSSIRVQDNCRAMGQAAGVAAAMSLEQKLSPRKLDGVALRKRLIEQGCNL